MTRQVSQDARGHVGPGLLPRRRAYSWSEGTRIEEEIFTVVARDGVENSAVEIRTFCSELSRRVSIPDSRSRQASRCYDYAGQTRDVLRKIIEQRDVLCFQDEFSGIVSNLKTAISFSGRQGLPADTHS